MYSNPISSTVEISLGQVIGNADPSRLNVAFDRLAGWRVLRYPTNLKIELEHCRSLGSLMRSNNSDDRKGSSQSLPSSSFFEAEGGFSLRRISVIIDFDTKMVKSVSRVRRMCGSQFLDLGRVDNNFLKRMESIMGELTEFRNYETHIGEESSIR